MNNGTQTSLLQQIVRGIEVLRGEVCCKLRQSSAAATYTQITSTASTNAGYITTTPESFYGVVATNTSGSAAYIKIYDDDAAPTVGTDQPVLIYMVPANSTINLVSERGTKMTTGVGFAITTGAAYTDTGAVGAGDIEMTLLHS